MRIHSKERYLSYALLIHIRYQNIKLKLDLKKFTTGKNIYPKPRTKTLHLLEKNSKISARQIPASEGLSFAKRDANKGKVGGGGDKNRGDDKAYDNKYRKDKELYKCVKKGNCWNYNRRLRMWKPPTYLRRNCDVSSTGHNTGLICTIEHD